MQTGTEAPAARLFRRGTASAEIVGGLSVEPCDPTLLVRAMQAAVELLPLGARIGKVNAKVHTYLRYDEVARWIVRLTVDYQEAG